MQYKPDFYQQKLNDMARASTAGIPKPQELFNKPANTKKEEGMTVRLNIPYPPVKVEEKRKDYARMMLDNHGGRNSEMTAIALYLYDNLVLFEHNEKLADVFMAINEVEMRHLHIFGKLAKLLGAEPRLWTKERQGPKYWSPAYVQYSHDPAKILQQAITEETQAIEKYIKQSEVIEDKYIVEMLKRIIVDEKHHVEIFKALQKEYL